MSIRSGLFIVLSKSPVNLLICLVVLSMIESGILNIQLLLLNYLFLPSVLLVSLVF